MYPQGIILLFLIGPVHDDGLNERKSHVSLRLVGRLMLRYFFKHLCFESKKFRQFLRHSSLFFFLFFFYPKQHVHSRNKSTISKQQIVFLTSHHLHGSNRKCNINGPCCSLRRRVRASQTRLPFWVVVCVSWGLVRVTAVVFFFPESLQFSGRGPRASVCERAALLPLNVPS